MTSIYRHSLVAVIVVLFALSGCGKRPTTDVPATASIDSTNGATITGTVSLRGPTPLDANIPNSDHACNCSTVTAEHWIVHDGKVANAFIYIKDGLGNKVYAAPARPVLLDQKGCLYRPHVTGLVAGQTLKILNSDSTLHNVHLVSSNVGECFNKLFPQAMAPMEQKLTTPGVMKTLKCDVHSWMNCYVGVLSHPFFAVSDENGHFEIRGVPPGEYTIELWHESSSGAENAIVETQTLTVAAHESKTADFSITAR